MIVIPLIQQNSYEELRYCLRAIEKYYPEQSVMIVGPYLPTWIRNILHLPHTDRPQLEFKTRNIYDKIVSAFNHMDEMLFFNDDHHILAPVDYLHHKGPMTVAGRHVNSTYGNMLRNTLQLFPGTMDYDTHCPQRFFKVYFDRLKQYDWDRPYAQGIKTSYTSTYFEHFESVGDYYPDLKFKTEIGDISNRLYFSTGDNCNLAPLKLLYPNKSKFEK